MKKKITAIICVLVVVIGFTVVDIILKENDKEDKPVVVVEEVTPVIEPEVEEVIEIVEPAIEPEVTEIVEPEIEEVIEVTPEPEITEALVEEVVTEAPVEEEVTPEPTPAEVVEVKPEPTEAPTPKPTATLAPKPEPTKAPTPKPTKKPEPTPTPKPEPTPTTAPIIEATEEEMITGKFNNFTKVKSTYTVTADYVDSDWVFHADDVSTITINKDGLKSSGSYKSYITNTKWKDNCEYTSTFKYGETKWKYTDSTGDSWEEERVKLTKDITKFGFDFDRFKVNKSETTKDKITITGTYTLSTTANTVYDMLALEILEANGIVGNVNKVTADVTITIDLTTKSMEKVVLKYNMNGEVFGTASSETGELDVFTTSYTHTFAFK